MYICDVNHSMESKEEKNKTKSSFQNIESNGKIFEKKKEEKFFERCQKPIREFIHKLNHLHQLFCSHTHTNSMKSIPVG